MFFIYYHFSVHICVDHFLCVNGMMEINFSVHWNLVIKR